MSIFKTVGTKKLQYLFLASVTILFIALGTWGFFSGIARGRSLATYNNVSAIYQALKYYYSDQGRYPSQDQYYAKKILTVFYLSDIPKPEDVSGACKDYSEFKYQQNGPQTFSLTFCLTQGVNGLSSGVHTLTEKGLH